MMSEWIVQVITENLLSIFTLAGYTMLNAGYVPQILKLYHLKSSREISISFLGLIFFGIILLTPQALLEAPLAFKIGAIIGLITSGVLLFEVVYYRIRDRKCANL